jgi:hypothetical protein
MAKLVANLTELDHGYSVQTWCPTLSCAMRVVGEILAVNPDAFGQPPVAHLAVEFEADPMLREMIERGEAADDPEPATAMGINHGTAYMSDFGANQPLNEPATETGD